ncbi:hypothetical protein IFR05_000088 [Cadophora sp. M221]|nr:hypothetical protein IFR05_000088 [Cadophora sp. M221]
MDGAARKNLASLIERDGAGNAASKRNPNTPKTYASNSMSEAERRARMSVRPTSLDFKRELQSRSNLVMPAKPAFIHRESLEQSGNSRPATTLRRVGDSGDLRAANTSTPTNANAIPIGSRISPASRVRAPTINQQFSASTPQSAIVNKTDRPWNLGTPKCILKSASLPPSTPSTGQQGNVDQHPSSIPQKQPGVTPSSTKTADNDLNGSHKRVKESKSSEDEGGDIRTSKPSRKKAKHAVEPNDVGHHVDDHHLRVHAKIKPQISEKGTQEIDLYVIRNPVRPSSTHMNDRHTVEIIHVSKAVLSSTIFSAYANELQAMRSDKKLNTIMEYLLALRKEDEPMADEKDEDGLSTCGGSPAKYRYFPEFLEIGYHRDDTHVPVQACVRLYGNTLAPTVVLKVLKEHGKDSEMDFWGRSVKDTNNILFKPEFRGPTVLATRSRILSHCKILEIEPKCDETQTQTPSKKPSLPLNNGTPLPSEPEEIQSLPKPATQLSLPAIRKAENQLLSSQRDVSEVMAELQNEKLAAEARDSKIKQKMKAYEELEKRTKSREEDVEKQEIDLKAQDKTLKDLEENFNARKKAIGGQEAVSKSLIDLEKKTKDLLIKEKYLDEKEKDLKDWQDEKQKLDVDLRDRRAAVMQRERDCNSRETRLAERENSVTARERKATDLDMEMKERYTTLISNESKIKQRELEFLRKETDASQRPIAPPRPFSLIIPLSLNSPNTEGETKFTFEKNYKIVPPGHPNTGKYARRAPEKRVYIEGKLFVVNRFLQEFTGTTGPILDPKIAVDGTLISGVISYAGLQLLKYEKDGILKLVQKFGNRSLFRFEARFFVSWYVYKEVEDRVDYTI